MNLKEKLIFKIKQIAYYIAYGSKATNDRYVAHLREIGILIGEKTHFYDPKSCWIDETRPCSSRSEKTFRFPPMSQY